MTSVCDAIGNMIPTNTSKWSFEIKLFRENPHSMGTEPPQNQFQRNQPVNFLHTVTFSSNPKEIVCLVKGVGTSFKGPFDLMLSTKLQSLWQLRQAIRGEGTAFEMNGGEYWIRLGNLMLQGNLRGLLIEVEYTLKDSFFKKSDIPAITQSDNKSKVDLTKSEAYGKIKSMIDLITGGFDPLKETPGHIVTGPEYVVTRTEPFTRVETAWQYIEALGSR